MWRPGIPWLKPGAMKRIALIIIRGINPPGKRKNKGINAAKKRYRKEGIHAALSLAGSIHAPD